MPPFTEYRNIQFGQLVTLLQNRLQNTGFWTGIEYRQNLDEALKLLQVTSLYWRSRFAATTIAGLVFYDLTSLPGTLDANGNPQILMPLRVAFNSNPLSFSSIGDIDNGIVGWQQQTTASPGAPDEPQIWGTLGLGYMFLWPSDAVGNNSIQIDAAVRAPWYALDGSDDAKFVNIDSAMISSLLDYAQHVCQQKRQNQMLFSTNSKFKGFMRTISQQNSLFLASSIFKDNFALQQDRKNRTAGDFSGKPVSPRYR